MVECLRMRHQSGDPAGYVADSGNIFDRTVRIERKLSQEQRLPSGFA